MQDDLTEHQLALINFLQKWESMGAFNHSAAKLSFCTPSFRANCDVEFINNLGFYHAEIVSDLEYWGVTEITVSPVTINTIDQ
jgi:hypothetical protein